MSRKTVNWKCGVSGALAGFSNGFFGAGGGMVLVPLLLGWVRLEEKKAFATSVAVILPICAVSCAVYWWKGLLDLGAALPFLLSGAVGGWLGGRWYGRVSGKLLRRIFALLTIYGGFRCLF